MPEEGDHETSTFHAPVRERRLTAHRWHAFWKGVDSLNDVHELEQAIEEGEFALCRARGRTSL